MKRFPSQRTRVSRHLPIPDRADGLLALVRQRSWRRRVSREPFDSVESGLT
jgi:hypothetical protein